MPEKLRFAVLGAGFWAHYQIAAWREQQGVECVAVYNRRRERAEALASAFGIPRVYDNPDEILDQEALDFVDIVTAVETHPAFVGLCAKRRLPVICQKPMASTLEEAEGMVATCRSAEVLFLVHENWRWQAPIRALAAVLNEGRIGRPFRGRVSFVCSFPVLDNQPFLKELDQFILTDIGSHILDTARFLFGEADRLYCETARIHTDIRGEDVATVLLHTERGAAVTCEMSYASRTEQERFPQTFIFIEGEKGSAELAPDHWVRVTTAEGTHSRRYPPPRYPWADPTYDLVQSSMVPCQADLLRAVRGKGNAETTGPDNLKTMRLVFAAYESARIGQAVAISREEPL
ncbi:MAG: Gfo/Idh/MocA family oxidoreductase [Armatimonadetes bacterium]|nr:Gfo/Idh/MocA family oxidoreductase [Armatimonadota bacterium]